MLLLVLTLCSAVAFLFFGYQALVADRVRREFERYGMPQFRVVIGSLQILGALGALAGLVNDMIGALATGGLMLMMLIGVVVRFRSGTSRSSPEVLPVASITTAPLPPNVRGGGLGSAG